MGRADECVAPLSLRNYDGDRSASSWNLPLAGHIFDQVTLE